MRVRQTSHKAYREVMESGIVSKLQKAAYDCLFMNGEMTGRELSVAMGIDGQWKRLSELKKVGLVIETGKRICEVSGKTALTWDVTDKAPQKPFKRKSRVQQLQEQIEELKIEIEMLNQLIDASKKNS